MLLVVVEDGAHTLDTGIFMSREVLLESSLVPIKDTADERRDEEGIGFGSSNGLDQREHKGQVAVDSLLLEDFGRLNTFPGRGNLDQDTRLVNTLFFVKLGVGKYARATLKCLIESLQQ